MSETLPARKRMANEEIVNTMKKVPLLAIPKWSLQSGINVSTIPKAENDKNVMMAGFKTSSEIISFFEILSSFSLKLCLSVRVSLSFEIRTIDNKAIAEEQ